jgi:formiminoglutamase
VTISLSDDPLWPRAGGWPAPTHPHDILIVGVPTHTTSLSPTHAEGTPDAIRQALRRYSTDYVTHDGRVVDLGGLSIADLGNLDDVDSDEGRAHAITQIRQWASTPLIIALGGDNAATYPVARAIAGDRPETAGLITLDAHFDLRDGQSNGSPVRELLESGFRGEQIVQIGIADFANSSAYAQRAHDAGITVVPRSEVDPGTLEDIAERALSIASAGGGPIHVDIDVDVCDRSVAPATPASLPGGLQANELRQIVRRLAQHPSVASFDITEISYADDTADQRTVRLAALLVLEIITGFALRSQA